MEVRIKIKDPILRCYLRGLFKQRADGSFMVTIYNCTGAVICGLIDVADRPTMYSCPSRDMVTFHLPISRINSNLRGRHLRLSDIDEQKVNVVLRREFDINFIAYCNDARIQGMKIKDAISMFIIENSMDIFDSDLETMKKRYYRYELATLKNMHEKLRQKVYSLSKQRRIKFQTAITR